MNRFAFIAVVAVAVAVQPAHARAKDAAAPIQLLQSGDSQMGCQALATEINTLAIADAKPKKKKGFGLGGFGKVLMMASPLGALAGNGIAGQLATQAAGMAQQGAMEAQASGQSGDTLDAPSASQSVEAQRKARLMGFFSQKGC